MIWGSGSLDGDYNENLRGFAGNDIIYGRAGHDELRGGENNDLLYGDDGFDVLIAGTGFDELHGGTGWDTLCTEEGSDLLIGSPAPTTADWNTLYISQSGGTPNPNSAHNSTFGNCGHANHGPWGGCPAHTLTAAPSACANDVAD